MTEREVVSAGMVSINSDMQPFVIWVVDTYVDEQNVVCLRTDEYTNWSYIILVPKPVAEQIGDWGKFVKQLGHFMASQIDL